MQAFLEQLVAVPLHELPRKDAGHIERFYQAAEAAQWIRADPLVDSPPLARAQKLYALFDTAVQAGLGTLVLDYLTEVCLDASAVSSDPAEAWLLDARCIQQWAHGHLESLVHKTRALLPTLTSLDASQRDTVRQQVGLLAERAMLLFALERRMRLRTTWWGDATRTTDRELDAWLDDEALVTTRAESADDPSSSSSMHSLSTASHVARFLLACLWALDHRVEHAIATAGQHSATPAWQQHVALTRSAAERRGETLLVDTLASVAPYPPRSVFSLLESLVFPLPPPSSSSSSLDPWVRRAPRAPFTLTIALLAVLASDLGMEDARLDLARAMRVPSAWVQEAFVRHVAEQGWLEEGDAAWTRGVRVVASGLELAGHSTASPIPQLATTTSVGGSLVASALANAVPCMTMTALEVACAMRRTEAATRLARTDNASSSSSSSSHQDASLLAATSRNLLAAATRDELVSGVRASLAAACLMDAYRCLSALIHMEPESSPLVTKLTHELLSWAFRHHAVQQVIQLPWNGREETLVLRWLERNDASLGARASQARTLYLVQRGRLSEALHVNSTLVAGSGQPEQRDEGQGEAARDYRTRVAAEAERVHRTVLQTARDVTAASRALAAPSAVTEAYVQGLAGVWRRHEDKYKYNSSSSLGDKEPSETTAAEVERMSLHRDASAEPLLLFPMEAHGAKGGGAAHGGQEQLQSLSNVRPFARKRATPDPPNVARVSNKR